MPAFAPRPSGPAVRRLEIKHVPRTIRFGEDQHVPARPLFLGSGMKTTHVILEYLDRPDSALLSGSVGAMPYLRILLAIETIVSSGGGSSLGRDFGAV